MTDTTRLEAQQRADEIRIRKGLNLGTTRGHTTHGSIAEHNDIRYAIA